MTVDDDDEASWIAVAGMLLGNRLICTAAVILAVWNAWRSA